MITQRMESRRQRRSAFTLMEMMIVVAIIVALAGIGVVSYFSLYEGSQKDIAQTKIRSLTTACGTYKLRNGNFPDSLQTLLQPDAKKVITIDDPAALVDPWGKAWVYDANGSHNGGRQPDISCISPDGLVIGNWPANR